MPAAPTPPLNTGAPMDTAPGKASTDTSVTSFALATHSHRNSETTFSSKTQKRKSYVFDSNVPHQTTINCLPRGSSLTGKMNCNTKNNNGKDPKSNLDANCSSLQSKLSMPLSPNYLESEGCKNSRARCTELNEFISCIICKGYLIDATTVVECLHSCKYK